MKSWMLCMCVFAIVVGAWASGSSWSPKEPAPAGASMGSEPMGPAEKFYERGKQALENGNFSEAEKSFRQSDAAQPNNPDTLNLLAYSQRKQGRLDEAFVNYRRALKLRPKFPEAREYLGEAHLQAVLQQIKILKSYGEEGKAALSDLLEAMRETTTDAGK